MIGSRTTEHERLFETILSRLYTMRPLLWVLAAFGFVVLNGTYLFYAVTRPDLVSEAMANPISLVFMTEVVLFLVLGAWLIARAGLRRPGWIAFVVLSFAGGLIFSIPAFLLLHLRKRPA